MSPLITPDRISFKASISEEELRKRMGREVLEQIGGCDADGKPNAGIRVSITRGTGKAGGYHIEVTGPAPARILLPQS